MFQKDFQFMHCSLTNRTLVKLIEIEGLNISFFLSSFVIKNEFPESTEGPKIIITSAFKSVTTNLQIDANITNGFECESITNTLTFSYIFLFTLFLTTALLGTVESLLDFEFFRTKLYLKTRLMGTCDYAVLKNLKVFLHFN